MSAYRVEWLPEAEDDLIAIWTDAPERQAVTSAERRISKRLENDPGSMGVMVAEGLRKLHEPPSLVYFMVDEAGRLVEVAAARYLPA